MIVYNKILRMIVNSRSGIIPKTNRSNLEDLVACIQSKSGDVEQSWNQLVRQYTGFITRLAQKYPVDQDELQSAGLGGLMDATRTFNFELGNKFHTHAATRIRGAILDRLRELRIENNSLGSRTRFSLLDELHRRLDCLRSDGTLVNDDTVIAVLTRIMEDSNRPPTEDKFRPTFDAVLELHRRPPELAIDAPINRHDPTSLRRDIADPKQTVDLDLMDGCPLEDCSFPPKDNFIYHIPGLTRREMIMLDLYAGISIPEPMVMRDIGDLFGLSESRISQQFSTLIPLIKQHETRILQGRLTENEIAIENDPFYKLLIRESNSARMNLERKDLKNLKFIRRFLTDDENAKIKTIRGGDNEYSIPPLNKDLEKIWSLDRPDVERMKQELAQKALLFTKAYVMRHSSDTHLNLAIRNITAIGSRTKANRETPVRSFLEGLGYNSPQCNIGPTTNYSLYGLLTSLNTLNSFARNDSTDFTMRRNCARAVANLLLNEPKNSAAFQLIQSLPGVVESLVQRITSPVLIEAQELSKLGLLTREGLNCLFKEHEGSHLENNQLTSYIRRHGLQLSRNNFWNLVNEPKTKAKILEYASKRARDNMLTYTVLRKAIRKYTGRDYKTLTILSKFARDNGLKIYRKKYHLGLTATVNRQVKKRVEQNLTQGRIAIGKLKEIIKACAPDDFPLDTIPDAQIKSYAQKKLGVNLEHKKRESRIKPYRAEIIQKAKEQITQQGSISLVELNRIIKAVAGVSYRSNQSLLKFADASGINLTQRSGVTQIKAPANKPRPSQPRIKISKDQAGEIVERARRGFPKGLLNERRLNSIVHNVCGQLYPPNSTALHKFATTWGLQLRTKEPATVLEDVDRGLSTSIAINELLIDCRIFIDTSQRKPTKIDADASIKTLATEKIANLSVSEKYDIVKQLVMAPASSEIGQFVRRPSNYQRILANLAG